MLPLPHTHTHTHTHTNCAQPRIGTDVQTQSSEQPASRRLVLSLTAVSVSVVIIDVAILLGLPSSLPLRRLYFQHYSLEARLSTIVRVSSKQASKQAAAIATYLLLCTYPPPHFGLLRLHSAIIVGASRRGPDDYRTTITTTSKSIVHR